jgi:alpha-L-fucosidase
MWKGEQIPDLGEQIQRHAKIPGKEYVPVGAKFNPVKFDARGYARLAKAAGMKYIIITSKHHDGFAMFDSKYTDFDIMDATPYKKDIIKMLADACREEGLQFGVYYSNPDWHHNNHTMDDTKFTVNEGLGEEYMEFSKNQLRELLTNYGPMNEIFFDMGKPTLEQSQEWAQTVRKCQPDCLVSGRVMNRQGDFYTMSDNSEPDTPIATPWEVPCTFSAKPGHTWGYKSWMTRPALNVEVKKRIMQLGRVASRGGNYLLNIGPLPDGTILPYHVEALEAIGKWVAKNREAIFDVKPTPFEMMPWGEATWREGKLYLQIKTWPKNGKLVVANLLTDVKKVYPMGDESAAYLFEKRRDVLTVKVSAEAPDENLTILVAEFDGELKTQVPIALQKEKGRIVLDGSVRLSRGFYTGMAYHHAVKDTRISWDYEVSDPGRYEVEMTYSPMRSKKQKDAKLADVPLVLTVEGKEMRFELPMSAGERTVSLGSIDVAGSDRSTMLLTTDMERFKEKEKKFHYGLARVMFSVKSVRLTKVAD